MIQLTGTFLFVEYCSTNLCVIGEQGSLSVIRSLRNFVLSIVLIILAAACDQKYPHEFVMRLCVDGE